MKSGGKIFNNIFFILAAILLVSVGISYFSNSTNVSITGPIGFVGLIITHFLRFIFGADNRNLSFS